MKKQLLLMITLIFLSLSGKCVIPLWEWSHNFNGYIASVEYHDNFIYTAGTFSGSAFVLGNTNIPNQGGKDVVVIKWDTLGNIIWATPIYGTSEENAVSIKVNSSNELVVAVKTNSAVINAGGNALNVSNGMLVAKYNLNGIYLNHFFAWQAMDMCTDAFDNIYFVDGGEIRKYSNAGSFMWNASVPAVNISYSAFDSTVVVSGSFNNTLTFGNFSITADVNVNWTPQNDLFVSKVSSAGVPLWLVNATGTSGIDFRIKTYINNNTGHVYAGCGSFSNPQAAYVVSIKKYSVAGTYMGAIGADYDSQGPWSISGKGNYISFVTNIGSYVAISVYNIATMQPVVNYEQAGYSDSLPNIQLFNGPSSIYTLGYNNGIFKKFGKIGIFSQLSASPTFQTITGCEGSTMTLTGNASGGMSPLTYSWLPVTGLNNTNTNTVSFTATSNISYTLTVTDNIGQIVKDTFNIVVDTLLPAVNITSQYPTLCDSMQLYANNGVTGNWYRFMPLNLPNNQWQLFDNDTTVTVYSAGTYRYSKSNTCNNIADTIDIAGTLAVAANATSDSICAGQSVTLAGSGAMTYTWTGGITNNVPFNPVTTQTYVVTGTDGSGCSNTSYIQIVINNSPNINSSLSICESQTPYAWNGQSLDSTGTYTANFTNIYGCDSVETLNLTVSPCIVCVPNFTINYSPYYYALTESQSWITTSGTVLIPSGITVKLDANSASYVRLNPGFKAEYGAVFVAQAYNGCTAGAPQLPQVGKVMNTDLFTADEIILYPNPTSGMIYIKHDEKLKNIQIFDMVGKLVINHQCQGETETNIDLSNLPNGVYHVKAVGYNSIKVVKKE